MTSPREYPAFLENFWLDEARAVTGERETESALEILRPAVQALSDLFTTERPDGGFPDYAADPTKRVAYGLFFFPQSFVKCSLALDPLLRLRGWRPTPSEGPVRLLDLGSASGPCGLAAALRLARETGRRVTLTAFDHSPGALAALERLARTVPEIAERVTVETKTGDMRHVADLLREAPPYDLITLGFSVNEVFGALDVPARLTKLESLRPLLTPDGLTLVLEPALRETAEPLRRVRDAALAGSKLHVWGPDIGDTPCPMLATGAKFWDHEVRTWTAPASLEFLNRKLHRDTRVLKFTQIALGVKPAPRAQGPAHTFRIVSPFEMNKGGFAFAAITREGQIVKIDIPNRGLSKSECKEIASTRERGDIAGCENWKALGARETFRIAGIAELAKVWAP